MQNIWVFIQLNDKIHTRMEVADKSFRIVCHIYVLCSSNFPDNKVHGANMGPIWGQQDSGGPHELCYLGWDEILP